MELVFINNVKTNRAEFDKKIRSIAYDLGVDPNWLMYVMQSESGLNPAATNLGYTFTSCGGGHAVGLIQFVPCTLQGLGYNSGWSEFKKLSNLQQLDYVAKYFKPFRGKMASVYDVYLVNFYPVAIGKPDDYSFPPNVTKGNPGFDLNKDGTITLTEFKTWLTNSIKLKVPTAYYDVFFKKKTGFSETPKTSSQE